jgi:hypothetical protein
MSHAIVKLINGDELITNIVERTDSEITIDKPAQVLRMMMPTGQAMVQCANYLIFNDPERTNLTIDRRQIIYMTEDIDSEVIKHYNTFVQSLDSGGWSHSHEQARFTPDEEEEISYAGLVPDRQQARDDQLNEKMKRYWEKEVGNKIDKRIQMRMLRDMDSSNNTMH